MQPLLVLPEQSGDMADRGRDGSHIRRRHRLWPEALKRKIVAASLAPSASASVVARQYDVNTNLVFAWRKRLVAAAHPPTPRSSCR